MLKEASRAPRYCLIQCQAGGHDEMCTLIYWAKLVPLRHINIDEGGKEAFGGQPEDFCHVALPLLLTRLMPPEVTKREGGGVALKTSVCLSCSFN